MTIATISIIVGVAILVLLKLFFKDEESSGQNKGPYWDDHDDELFKEEPEFDRTWSFLPGNIFHRSNDD